MAGSTALISFPTNKPFQYLCIEQVFRVFNILKQHLGSFHITPDTSPPDKHIFIMLKLQSLGSATAALALALALAVLTFQPALVKAAAWCDVTQYGAVADNKTDVAPAIWNAYSKCVVPGGAGSTLYIPCGAFAILSRLTFADHSDWNFVLDGYITLPGPSVPSNPWGNLFLFERLSNFQITGTGVIDGNGVSWRQVGGNTRLMRVSDCTNCKVIGLTFIDAPAFHLVVEQGSNVEIADIRVRGWQIGGTDGIDVSGTNIWVHNIHVTNRDECVTVKSPSDTITIEDVFCDMSGGSAIGSLGKDTSVKNILFRNMQFYKTECGVLLKAGYGATGIVDSITYDNIYIDGSIYPIYYNVDWVYLNFPPGVWVNNGTLQISNIDFRSMRVTNGYYPNVGFRPAVEFHCMPNNPCYNINFDPDTVAVWSDGGWFKSTASCQYAKGSGFCLTSDGSSNEMVLEDSTTQHYLPPVSFGVNGGNSQPKVCPLVQQITTARRIYEAHIPNALY